MPATKTKGTTTSDERVELEERDHLRGCPATRVESFPATRPGTATRPPQDIVVTRCIECGGSVVADA